MTRTFSLFSPYRLAAIDLPNRIVMAPLTRDRAGPGNVPTALMAEYYAQRAGAGLIISEGSPVCPEGHGYDATPGIHTPEQVAGWRLVTEAVHKAGGRIFIQLWHVGRVSNVALQPGGQAPVAPSALRAEARTFVNGEFQPTSMPRALDIGEIPAVVESFARAARNAVAAGFDGVELHGANGYLIDQFLRDGANRRDDAYGGPVAHRTRFLFEVVDAVSAAIGPERVGVRIAPVTPSNGIADSDPVPLFFAVAEGLDARGILYLHVVEGATGGARDHGQPFDFAALRRHFRGAYIANNGYDKALAEAALAADHADLIAFGRPFIANPDLVERLRRDAPLNGLVRETLYGGGAEGYTDYPVLASS
ncbi:alkene reductase [Zavarzinia compransoris]|uniref:Alkene reductase n=1 Tax=Zavarzinia compransoris TaxID=1264899 RepID=A0A317EAI1_9PROT|nr:alkene reductase [Zavarzinia compransoris]PWR23959.1 alkene reductase [Zavarzinia compransoris]TDP48209.1 N-ethylmaleimide reductase [Zavarzinia compransoris]